MKKNSKLCMVAAVFFLGITLKAASGTIGGEVVGGVENKYNIFTFLTKGPVRTNATWAAWATPTTLGIFNNRTLTNPVSSLLDPAYLSQPIPTYDKEVYWIPTRITRKAGGPQLNLGMVQFRQRSSDTGTTRPDGSLSNRYSYAGSVYTPQAIGVIWGPGRENGPRSEQQILDSGEDGNTMVDEIVTIGLQSKYYTYTNESQRTGIIDYINLVDLTLHNIVEVVSDNTVQASLTRSVQTTGGDPTGDITIAVHMMNGNVHLSLVGATNATPFNVVWQASPLGTNVVWTTIETVSSTNVLARVASGSGNLYRALRQ